MGLIMLLMNSNAILKLVVHEVNCRGRVLLKTDSGLSWSPDQLKLYINGRQ
jgi:hypothetical protein